MKDFFTPDREVVEHRYEEISPSGNFKLLVRSYKTKPGCWSYSRGTVYRLSDGAEICDIKRNYGVFHHSWIMKNNQEWMISGRSYLNQLAVNLDTGEVFENGKDGPYEFCWAACYISPDGNTLMVDGCYWACPYEFKFFDFTDPSKPWTELETDDFVDAIGGKNPVWLSNDTVKCFQCSEIYTQFDKTYDELTEEEIEQLSDNDDDWSWRVDATLTLQRQGNRMVTISEELTEKEKENRAKQKEANEKWEAWHKDFKENNELYLTLKEYADKFNINWDKHLGFGGGGRITAWFRESRKWFHNIPLLRVFKLRSVDLEWTKDNDSPIRVRLWDKCGHKYNDVEFEASKDGMISALSLVKKHTKRFWLF